MLLTLLPAHAQGTRLLRSPALSATHIAFVYGGDLWLADTDGSDVRRLTVFQGVESNPQFSPDGAWIAFTGQYDGNADVYIVAVQGGEPVRLTWHPGPDIVCGWTPDGSRVLFASGRTRAPYDLPDQLWTVSPKGEMPQRFGLPTAINGAFSPDGKQYVYEQVMPWEDEFRNYRGGQNNPLRIFDLASHTVTKLPWDNSRDIYPVWIGEQIYFLSDRDFAMNIWAYNTRSKALKQITFFKEFDCKQLDGHSGKLIFEQGGYLYTLNPDGGTPVKVPITVEGDFPWVRPHWSGVDKFIESVALSPTGKRVALSGRGEILTLPAEKGDSRNLSNSPGAADRAVAWSPDGQSISWFSDESGEYQLVIADQYGKKPRKIAIPNPTFFYSPKWSPDSKKLSFTDANRVLWIVDIASGALTRVDHEGFAHPQRIIYCEWSPDSKWLMYPKRLSNEYATVFIYSLDQKKSFQITDGMSDCQSPAWDASGKYIYFLSSIDYGMNVGWLDMSSYDHPINRSVYMVVLSSEDPSPLKPESDDEPAPAPKPAEPSPAPAAKGKKTAQTDKAPVDSAAAKPVRIDFEGMARRMVVLPIPARMYVELKAGSEGMILFTESLKNEEGLTLHRFTTEKRKVEKVVEGIGGFEVSADRKKLLYSMDGAQLAICDAGGMPDPAKGPLKVGELQVMVDPMAEWKQIFREAWRYQRDYFYVRNVHGLDLDWAYRTYAPWVEDVRHRSDLNYLLDILGGETSVGHSFVGGGDFPEVKEVPVGLLGADYSIENNRIRFASIYTGDAWTPEVRSPLSGPGILVKPGEYLLAVNGRPLDGSSNVYAALDRCADRQTMLTINDKPVMEGAREVTVVPVSSEEPLRQYAWIEHNRHVVDSLSGGKLAYVWLPNTGLEGYNNFNRYYFAQKNKQGAVIDERYNQGGSIADYIVDLLDRDLMGYFNNPIGEKQPFTAPNAGIFGPKVMIINEMAGSGGDMLPYMFRMRKVGPLVGTRTWGGLVGIWDVPSLIDGGGITAPRGGFYNVDGEWDVENEGIAPDILVEQEPALLLQGRDPQLEQAVRTCMDLLKTEAVQLKPQPADPVRVRRP
ncbi:MAG: protease [Bacteroidetes bacterium]|nr:MAG: protease [Bacteroidota bacterium]